MANGYKLYQKLKSTRLEGVRVQCQFMQGNHIEPKKNIDFLLSTIEANNVLKLAQCIVPK